MKSFIIRVTAFNIKLPNVRVWVLFAVWEKALAQRISMCACVCACACIYIYIYIYICVCVCVCACVRVCGTQSKGVRALSKISTTDPEPDVNTKRIVVNTGLRKKSLRKVIR